MASLAAVGGSVGGQIKFPNRQRGLTSSSSSSRVPIVTLKFEDTGGLEITATNGSDPVIFKLEENEGKIKLKLNDEVISSSEEGQSVLKISEILRNLDPTTQRFVVREMLKVITEGKKQVFATTQPEEGGGATTSSSTAGAKRKQTSTTSNILDVPSQKAMDFETLFESLASKADVLLQAANQLKEASEAQADLRQAFAESDGLLTELIDSAKA